MTLIAACGFLIFEERLYLSWRDLC
jgi:hypothetical protein